MGKIGVIVAMDKERDLLIRAGAGSVVLSGIGKVNAAAAATELILSEHPDCIISSGVAGSMSPMVKAGDMVIASETAYHDVWCGDGNAPGQVQGLPQRFTSSQKLLQAARGIGAGNTHIGLIVSGDQFYISQDEDKRILALYPDALACDMESAAIAQVCLRFGVPFLGIRTISDEHTGELRQKETYSEFWEKAPQKSFEFINSVIKAVESL